MITAALIDHREPPWMQALKFGAAPVAVTPLPAGDCHILAGADLLIVERKTPADLLASIADGRLFDQAARMAALSAWVYVVITGELRPTPNGRVIADGRETGWSFDAVQGALLTVQELGVKVVYCRHDLDFAACLERLAARDRGPVPVKPARTANLLSPAVEALIALPLVGPDRAMALLDHFGTAGSALEYLTDTTWHEDALAGIGNGVKAAVRRALGLVGKSYLRLTLAEGEPS
jgi:ERCC4-type nuclease